MNHVSGGSLTFFSGFFNSMVCEYQLPNILLLVKSDSSQAVSEPRARDAEDTYK